jgi:hypothetical protein
MLSELRAFELHGSHEPLVLPSPAAGAALTYTIPGSVEQMVLSVSFTLTCAAGGGVRTPHVDFLDYSGQPFASVGAPFTVAATFASRLTFGVGVQQFGAANAARIGAGIPPLRLGDGLQVRLTADGLAAGDTITLARMFVRQWAVRPFGADE